MHGDFSHQDIIHAAVRAVQVLRVRSHMFGVVADDHVLCTWQDDSLTVRVSLESSDGTTDYASTSFEDVDSEWHHYRATLTVPEEVLTIYAE